MIKPLAAIALLAVISSLAAVACGGSDDEEAPAAAPAAVAPEPTPGPATLEKLPPSVDLSQEGDTLEFTIYVSSNVAQSSMTNPMWGAVPTGLPGYIPSELTFRLGQTVNITLQPDDPSSKHSFTAPSLGINEIVKYGQAVSFTYTFDKTGLFHVFDTVDNRMTGTITVVE